MISKKIAELLKEREFISVATSSLSGRPNAAPKLILKTEGNFIYLVDYTIGQTYHNLQVNPHISLSFMDLESLLGYQINGRVEIISSGPDYDSIIREIEQRQLDLSIKRVIEGLKKEKSHANFEVTIPESLVIFKVGIEEIIEISPRGGLKRERV